MATKEDITKAEAKVLAYLHSKQAPLRYPQLISVECQIDYGYLAKVLRNMMFKKWLSKARSLGGNKTFYNLTNEGNWKVAEAKAKNLIKTEV